jgi:hypothetical protein
MGLMAAAIVSIVSNSLMLRQQSGEVAIFLAGLSSGCTRGEGILLYRTFRPAWPKVDVLLHASSYYGMFGGCVDLGNYETAYAFFPVRFNQDVGPLPPERAFALGE